MERKNKFRILALDGGGGKGVYTLGVLKELEAKLGGRLYQHFDLIYGTSTGSIIAACLVAGYDVRSIEEFYFKNVSQIMKKFRAKSRSSALRDHVKGILQEMKFNEAKTDIGIVTTNFDEKKPVVFKSSIKYAYNLKQSFVPGFGCTLADAVISSCSAFPFFEPHLVKTENHGSFHAIDGGFCANNPSFYALADAIRAFGHPENEICLLNVGVGNYPERFPVYTLLQGIKLYTAVRMISTQLDASSNSLGSLFQKISNTSEVVRVSNTYNDSSVATSLFEYDEKRLNKLLSKGRDSFLLQENEIENLFK